MEILDHAYTCTTYDKINPVEFTYKLSPKETEDFVKLRVSNNYLFSGRRNSSMWAWRAILKHMGLHHKMTHSQAAKKWENMKKKYKELKNPPEGVKVFPEMWPHFTLLDDAMEGRLEGSAPILKAFPDDKDDANFLPSSRPKKRKISMMKSTPSVLMVAGPEIEVSLNGDEEEEGEEEEQGGSREIERVMQEVENERASLESERVTMESERQVMEKEKQVMERERQVLQRERAALDREVAALDRDRASLERERAIIEREKAVMEREKAIVEKDRDAVSRDRLALDRERARLERLAAAKGRTEEVKEGGEEICNIKTSELVDRKERFLNLFEKLIENF
ncbi:caldesmon-like [Centroberyx affinis]|uniref:caldesmon-like n=1 Tax=Centroberyx affinis TaxID=166261 RepID=UPI003A5BCA8C